MTFNLMIIKQDLNRIQGLNNIYSKTIHKNNIRIISNNLRVIQNNL